MKRKSSHHLNRSGFTLLELLIAAVLVSALMSAVWGIMSLYNSMLTAGQAEATEQQLVRSLFQLMSEDFSTVLTPLEERKVPEVPLNAEENAFVELALDDEEFIEERSVFETTASSSNPAAPVFLGTSTAIRITTHKVIPQKMESELSDIDLLNELGGGSFSNGQTEQEGEAPAVSEFQTVVYQFQLAGQNESGESLPAGLYRIQVDSLDLLSLLNDRSTLQESRAEDDVRVDRLTLESLLFPQSDRLEESSETELETDQIVPHYDLVPEVVGCQFEYFDGANWGAQWPTGENSEVSYPAAIRIRLDVINSQELEELTALETPARESNELEQELNDSFSVETDQIETNPGANDTESEQAGFSPEAGIAPRSYWRIFLLENPKPQYEADGISSQSGNSSRSLEGFQQ